MLWVLLDSAPDGVDKNLGLAQALAKKGFESLPANRDISLVFYLMRMLLPSEQGGILQEGSRKQNLVWARGTGGGEVIFALLEEIVTLQVSFTSINVWKPSFQKPLTWAFIVRSGDNNGSRNWCRRRKKKRSSLKDGLDNPLEVILQVPNHGGVGGARSNKQSNDKCKNGSKSTCCSRSRSATVATLDGDSTSELVFAVVRNFGENCNEQEIKPLSWLDKSS